jgi:hypothetical protein
VKGDMTGRSLTGGLSFWGEAFWRGDGSSGLDFLVLLLVLRFWGTIAGGTGLLGVLGTGARIPFGFLELGSRTGCS